MWITCFDPHLISVRGLHFSKCLFLLYLQCGLLKSHVSIFWMTRGILIPTKGCVILKSAPAIMHCYLDHSSSEKLLQTFSQSQALAPHNFLQIYFWSADLSVLGKKALEKKGFTYTVFSIYDLLSTWDLSISNAFGLLKVNEQFRGQIGIVSSG